MLRTRVIPALLLRGTALVKTVRFKDAAYIGDPINTVRIFNELEVDELVFLDIGATPDGKRPQLQLLEEIAVEAFMPFGYGGAVQSVEDARAVFELGAEKVIINTAAFERPALVSEIADRFGSQAIVVSIDVKKRRFGGQEVVVRGGRQGTGLDPVAYAASVAALGAGELLLTSVDRDGTYGGYDLELVRRVADAVEVPVIACGGARTVDDLTAGRQAGASALAAGSMFVYQGQDRGVLVNFPPRSQLEAALP